MIRFLFLLKPICFHVLVYFSQFYYNLNDNKQRSKLLNKNEWSNNSISQRKQIEIIPPGGGRKLTDKELEEKVLNWINDHHENMLRVSRKLIMKKAKILDDESVGDDLSTKEAFVASQGWLEKFMTVYLCVDEQLQLRKIHLTL